MNLLVYLLVLLFLPVTAGCLVCHEIIPSSFQRTTPSTALGVTALTRVLEKRPVVTLGLVACPRLLSDRRHSVTTGFWSSENEDAKQNGSAEEAEGNEQVNALSSAMIVSIGFYKNFISPLLPPACRFVPTCSQYGVQAISEFGPTKGFILTAWRLLRCSPIGGRGYDPPQWPPVPYTYSSY